MNITTYEMNKILNHVFSGKTTASLVYTSGSFHLGLSTTEIESDGTGATEPSSAYNYSRYPIPPLGWSESFSAEVENLIDATFTAQTGAWGTIRSVFLVNHESNPIPTSASICYYYNLPTPFPVLVNTTVTFSSGSITVSIA